MSSTVKTVGTQSNPSALTVELPAGGEPVLFKLAPGDKSAVGYYIGKGGAVITKYTINSDKTTATIDFTGGTVPSSTAAGTSITVTKTNPAPPLGGTRLTLPTNPLCNVTASLGNFSYILVMRDQALLNAQASKKQGTFSIGWKNLNKFPGTTKGPGEIVSAQVNYVAPFGEEGAKAAADPVFGDKGNWFYRMGGNDPEMGKYMVIKMGPMTGFVSNYGSVENYTAMSKAYPLEFYYATAATADAAAKVLAAAPPPPPPTAIWSGGARRRGSRRGRHSRAHKRSRSSRRKH